MNLQAYALPADARSVGHSRAFWLQRLLAIDAEQRAALTVSRTCAMIAAGCTTLCSGVEAAKQAVSCAAWTVSGCGMQKHGWPMEGNLGGLGQR